MIRVRRALLMLIGSLIALFFGCGEYHSCLEVSDEEGLVTSTVGVTDGKPYEFGTVLVTYEDRLMKSSSIAVNDFLSDRGYRPKSVGFVPSDTEVISIGREVNLVPLLKKLKAIPGVTEVSLNSFYSTAELLFVHIFSSWGADEERLSLTPSGAEQVEVGKTEDGVLYRFGVMLVRYEENIQVSEGVPTLPAITAVSDFFVDRRYTPKVVYAFSNPYNIEIVKIGACVDTAPMLEELKAIPGVADAYLDILYSNADRLSGKVMLPIM